MCLFDTAERECATHLLPDSPDPGCDDDSMVSDIYSTNIPIGIDVQPSQLHIMALQPQDNCDKLSVHTKYPLAEMTGAAGSAEVGRDTNVLLLSAAMRVGAKELEPHHDARIGTISVDMESLRAQDSLNFEGNNDVPVSHEPLVLVSPSSRYVPKWDRRFLTRTFVNLFLYGRGGPDENRTVPVGLDRCLEHYLRLSTGQFLGPGFILPVFNLAARKHASSKSYVQGQFILRSQSSTATSKAEAFSNLAAEQLCVLKTRIEKCHYAKMNNQIQPVPPPELAANGLLEMFMDSVKHITSAMPHTNEQTKNMRAKAHSMCYHFGNPTWFITVNSNNW